ncbi:MAG: hypothetical protein QXV69_07975 [Sulfolobaceae archaeon]
MLDSIKNDKYLYDIYSRFIDEMFNYIINGEIKEDIEDIYAKVKKLVFSLQE